MTTRPARLRPTLNVKMDLENQGPETKRRKLGPNNGLNSNGNGGQKRSGTGPRTRGMIESSNDGDDGSNGPTEKLLIAEEHNSSAVERGDEKQESSSESSSSESSDSSDSEDSSDLDADECNQQAEELNKDLVDMDKQFIYLRELFYRERLVFTDGKLTDIRAGTAYEFLNQLEQLQENMKVRVVVASCLRDYRFSNLDHKFRAEEIGALQNFESDKALHHDLIKLGLEEKIHRLEQDRNNDFSSELWLDKVMKRKNKKSVDIFGEKKKKPVLVSGPFIVYMLHDVDIVEDWTIIKKAAAAPNRMLKVF